ncbi:hypothetical protein WAF17_05205 [Bernardetia sp. ABR2-2B]|uniref:hypothetical protein n=1 Tax=Bernardetia sp. ABR2-2B TaxID=3127472 RepID=UPI0030D2DA81
MKLKLLLLIAFLVALLFTFSIQTANAQTDSTYKKHFIGSTFFMLGNLLPENKPDFVQLNLGYRINPKNVISVEFKTWKYEWSLGIPYGKSYEAPEEKFPGYIREYGVAVAYQHFWWKGLYNAVHAMNAHQTFVDEEGKKIKNGYQLFMTYRLGYQFKFFKNRFFLEPSIAITHRPFHTKMPESFKVWDDKWSKFFFGEPGLHFGFNF